jgi:hypothetical protein
LNENPSSGDPLAIAEAELGNPTGDLRPDDNRLVGSKSAHSGHKVLDLSGFRRNNFHTNRALRTTTRATTTRATTTRANTRRTTRPARAATTRRCRAATGSTCTGSNCTTGLGGCLRSRHCAQDGTQRNAHLPGL